MSKMCKPRGSCTGLLVMRCIDNGIGEPEAASGQGQRLWQASDVDGVGDGWQPGWGMECGRLAGCWGQGFAGVAGKGRTVGMCCGACSWAGWLCVSGGLAVP